MESEVLNISLEELSNVEYLSGRAINLCEYNNLHDLYAILNYYWENGDFLKLRNCGHKTNSDLLDICIKYGKCSIIPIKESVKFIAPNPLLDKIELLTARQRQIINNLINSKLKELSFRSSNALLTYSGSTLDLNFFTSVIFNDEFRVENIRNVGAKSNIEINNFINSIKDLIELVSVFENEDKIRVELFNTYLINKFSVNSLILSEIWNGYNPSYGLPIFKTVHILIENEILLDHRERYIFKSGFNYYNNTNIETVNGIAGKMDMTRERIRQLRQILYKKIPKILSFITALEFDAINIYGLDCSVDYIMVDNDLVDEINRLEDTNFNLCFVNKILSILFSDKYILIGNEENVIFNKNSRNEHNWNNTYLIMNEYAKQFDFERLINDVDSRLKKRIEDEYCFHFETYLHNFFKVKSYNSIIQVLHIAEFLLLSECDLTIDSEDNIVFKKNVRKQVVEYVYDVLDEKNEPLNVSDIFAIIEKKYPGITKNAEALRGSCQRNSNLIYFGRSSTYGLKKWEDELKIKGGTIRDITEEFLERHDKPIHVNDIAKYVIKYRDTNIKSIYTNLKMDESKRFLFFKGAYIGLLSKKYPVDKYVEILTIHKSIITWEERFRLLSEFVFNNKRLPYSHGVEETEIVLYRFLNMQLRKYRNGLLITDRYNLIHNLISNYDSNRRNRRHSKKF